MDISANEGSVMEFYWRSFNEGNVSFYFSRSPAFPKLLLLPDMFLCSLSVVAANPGPIIA